MTPTSRDTLQTPTALLDLDRLERNAAKMQRRARNLGVRLRPHVKTHKSPDIARVQTHGEPARITVSTLAEAYAFGNQGFRDITWAVPVPLSRIPQAGALTQRIDRLNLLADHPATVRALDSYGRSHDLTFDVLIKIDCGNHRVGLDPSTESVLQLARRIQSSQHLRFRGLLAHAGHAYGATTQADVAAIAKQERDVTVQISNRLRIAGIPVETTSIGSTPTVMAVDHLRGVTEIRPGNYALFDVFQATLGTCELDDIALRVMATVVGVYPERNTFVVDAGALALSKDPGPVHIDPHCGFGIVEIDGVRATPALRVGSLTQEHGVVEGLDRTEGLDVGKRVCILPNHSCLTAACFDGFDVMRGGEVIARWPLTRGWNP